MAKEDVLYEKTDHVAIVTLNRPDKLNAMTHEMYSMLGDICSEIRKDDDVRVAVLTGKGRCFCAGTDLSGEVPQSTETEVNNVVVKDSTEYRYSLWLFNSIQKPTICAINGAAVGAGAEYPLQCDIRIAAQSARWGEIFVRRGLIPDTGAGTYLLPRIVGLSKACELVFSGEIIDAQEMLRIGLVSQVVADDQLLPAAMMLAKKMMQGAPLAVQMAKQLMYLGLGRSLEDHWSANLYYWIIANKTQDAVEGVKSFLEKREPDWKGK